MPAFDVIVCGRLHLDIMVYAPDLPRRDETSVGTRWAMPCGGEGGNQLVMAACGRRMAPGIVSSVRWRRLRRKA